MHRRALKQAARVIVLGDDMRDRILSKGIAPEKVVVIRDGATPANPAPDRNHPVIKEIRGGSPFVALHAGNLGFYGAWQTLLEAAKILHKNGASAGLDPVSHPAIVFVGDGANKASLQAAAASIPNVRFLPFRPASEIPCVMMAGDVHIVTVRRGLEGVVVPSKLYSILAAGRPVLVVAPRETDAARIVLQWKCGLAANPDDPPEVAAAITELFQNPAKLTEMGLLAQEAAAKYARVAELKNFVSVIEQVEREHRGCGNS
jgi:colanic acid biosynthesis glycosyl transferase WcaI